jgi:DnaJ domain
MKATSKTLRRRAQRKPAAPSAISIQTNDGPGNRRWVSADLVDVIDGGCGLVSMTLLRSGSTVVVRGKLGQRKAAVRWCIGKPDGTFRAGLEFLDEEHPLDCYEVLQLSPNADAETISRVYRMLASRFHPDNTDTGNSEKFIRLCEAHQILSDPEKRARYDERHRDAMRRPQRSRGNDIPSSVGALRGWNAALGQPSS